VTTSGHLFFYHYTTVDRYCSIILGEDRGRFQLLPKRSFISIKPQITAGLPDEANRGATLGLLSPLDPAWCGLEYHRDEPALEAVLHDINLWRQSKICLLKVRVRPSDDVCVTDYSGHLRKDYQGQHHTRPKILKEVKTDFWNKLVPLKDYHRVEPYALPLVVCFSAIPKSRLSVEAIDAKMAFESFELINLVRKWGGFKPHPPLRRRSKVAQARQDAMLDEMLNSRKHTPSRRKRSSNLLHAKTA
jgi:hypothetical protein